MLSTFAFGCGGISCCNTYPWMPLSNPLANTIILFLPFFTQLHISEIAAWTSTPVPTLQVLSCCSEL